MSPALLAYIAQWLAVIACCFGGGLGGYTLARPEDAMAMVGLRADGTGPLGVIEARAFGGLLLVAHGGVAAALGYSPSFGAVMAFSLSLVWLGAAVGRAIAMLLHRRTAGLKAKPDDAVAAPRRAGFGLGGRVSAARGLLSLDLLMAASLALPLWMLIAPTLRQSGVQV
jgi:hypothetical protein